ncbi:hypothetical protein T01_13202 [Trichinella spiralis]|uniref:Uncharacterized protein n=1 Tax=Trichinella spiralis TaxID=6334 RepID=A0A0V1AYF5_TRISP|nr:hypothetical protein T01_13202 [Trichinella spiralis]
MTPVIFQNQPTVADRFGPDDQAGYGSAEARSSYWWCAILVSDRWRCDLSCILLHKRRSLRSQRHWELMMCKSTYICPSEAGSPSMEVPFVMHYSNAG